MDPEDVPAVDDVETGYEAPTVARVPLEEGTLFTAAAITSGMDQCW